MVNSVENIRSLLFGQTLVDVVFEFDYFTDSLDSVTNQRIADWVQDHRDGFHFENVPCSRVPLIGDSFSVEHDFVVLVRHRTFDVHMPGHVVVCLMCQVIDECDDATDPLEVQAELLNMKKVF